MLSIRESSWNIKIRALTRLSEKGPNYPPSLSQVFWMTLMCILLPACIWLFEEKGNQKLLLFLCGIIRIIDYSSFLWVWLYLNNHQHAGISTFLSQPESERLLGHRRESEEHVGWRHREVGEVPGKFSRVPPFGVFRLQLRHRHTWQKILREMERWVLLDHSFQ